MQSLNDVYKTDRMATILIDTSVSLSCCYAASTKKFQFIMQIWQTQRQR